MGVGIQLAQVMKILQDLAHPARLVADVLEHLLAFLVSKARSEKKKIGIAPYAGQWVLQIVDQQANEAAVGLPEILLASYVS
jgi:hypothetical protein